MRFEHISKRRHQVIQLILCICLPCSGEFSIEYYHILCLSTVMRTLDHENMDLMHGMMDFPLEWYFAQTFSRKKKNIPCSQQNRFGFFKRRIFSSLSGIFSFACLIMQLTFRHLIDRFTIFAHLIRTVFFPLNDFRMFQVFVDKFGFFAAFFHFCQTVFVC